MDFMKPPRLDNWKISPPLYASQGRNSTDICHTHASWHRRVFRIYRRDEADPPISVPLILHIRKRRNQMDPRLSGVQGDGIVLRIQKIDRAGKSSLLFPLTVACSPANGEGLPIAEEISVAAFAASQIDLELVVTVAFMVCEQDDHILEGELPACQPVYMGQKCA